MKKTTTLFIYLLIILTFALSACTAATSEPLQPEPPAPQEPEPAVEEPAPAEPASQNVLLLATTTSTQDSGLLDVILPDFTQKFDVEVDVIAVGTGQALTLGQDGNADVLLVHARAREDEFMAAEHGVRREDVMYNDFVIIGPESDPAGVMGLTDAAEAMKMIAETESPFISRGDDSGTHSKELSVWQAAGIEPSGDWYISAGQGMGEVITMADEQQAYTLSDRATYLARSLAGLDLVVVTEGDPVLFNPYGVIAVNPNKNPNIQVDLANQFIDWIISVPTQEMIAGYGEEEFGESLFIPSSELWLEANPDT
jgi:tungstate transport system substrate-binding protein